MKKNLSINETFALALKNYKQKNFEVTENSCRQILNINPDHFKAIWLMGLLSARANNFESAKRFFLKAVEIQPNNAKAYNNLGNTQRELEKFDKAASCYQKAVEIQPNNANAYYNLGNVQQRLEKFDEALICYQKVIEIKPDYFHAYYSLGNLQQKLGNLEKAKNFYEKAIKIMPKHASAYNNLGLTLSKLGKFSEAINCYQKAIEIKSNHAGAYINLGLAFTELGEFSKAVNYYQMAVKYEPENLSNYYYLSNLKKEVLDTNLKNKINEILNKNKSATMNLAYGNFLLSKYEFKGKNYEKELNYLIKGHQYYFEVNKEFKKEADYWLNDLPKIKELIDINHSSKNHQNNDYKIKPIFLIGVPRCGSTLIEKIISSSTKYIPMGEETVILSTFFKKQKIHQKKSLNLDDIENFKKKIFKKYEQKELIQKESDYIFTDKSLENFFFLGLIKEIFPYAKVINCKRSPLSSIMSIFQSNLTGLTWTHNLEHIFRYFDIYFDLIEFYKNKIPNFIYELQFEKFVSDPIIESKKLMKFCELPWDKKCLEYYKRKDLISKTSSNIQIRKAIYKHPIQRYMPYKQLLKKYGDKFSWFD